MAHVRAGDTDSRNSSRKCYVDVYIFMCLSNNSYEVFPSNTSKLENNDTR